MTRKEFGATYGASAADISKVTKTFQQFGLTKVGAVNPARRTVRLPGTVANMEKAFQVTLFDYRRAEAIIAAGLDRSTFPPA